MISKDAANLQLPGYKHLPGSNPRPDCSFLETVAKQAISPTEDRTANSNIAWLYGIRLYNAGYYWESHEILEAVWLNALPNSRERFLLQAVIHLANARLKMKMSRHAAVLRLQKLAMECMVRAIPIPEPLMGVRFDQLRQLIIEVETRTSVLVLQL